MGNDNYFDIHIAAGGPAVSPVSPVMPSPATATSSPATSVTSTQPSFNIPTQLVVKTQNAMQKLYRVFQFLVSLRLPKEDKQKFKQAWQLYTYLQQQILPRIPVLFSTASKQYFSLVKESVMVEIPEEQLLSFKQWQQWQQQQGMSQRNVNTLSVQQVTVLADEAFRLLGNVVDIMTTATTDKAYATKSSEIQVFVTNVKNTVDTIKQLLMGGMY